MGIFYFILRSFVKIKVSVKILMMADSLRLASFVAKNITGSLEKIDAHDMTQTIQAIVGVLKGARQELLLIRAR